MPLAVYEVPPKSECGCAHAQAARAAREPVLAVCEDDDAGEVAVLGCGDGGCGAGEVARGAPTTLRVERIARSSTGAYEVGASREAAIEVASEASDGPACLPWVRVVRDQESFRACMKNARKLGKMQTSRDPYELLTNQGRFERPPTMPSGDKWMGPPLDLRTEDVEVFMVLLLDTQLQLRGITELTRGARDTTLVPTPDVLRLAIVEGAQGIVVAHNHPSGSSKPSKADGEFTRALERAAEEVDLKLFDSLVVGAEGYYSFRDHGRLRLR